MSEVLYRKWRPQSFAEVVGQDHVTRTLRNSIASGKLAHAYLLSGPRGTGKTSLGRLLAKAANCAAPVEGEPCNACPSCQAFVEGRAMDFIEQDAASHNSVDDIRQLRENVVLTPMSGERKVYLLDEVHMLSKGAYNALLKTLEEPPPHIIFVLATTEPHKVESTIISRCQRFDLRRIPAAAVVDRLQHICQQEGFDLERDALEEIARSATGSLRDAVNGLEQVVTYYGSSPTVEQVQQALGLTIDARAAELGRRALAGHLTGSLTLITDVRDDGVDIKEFSRQTVRYLRGLLLARAGAVESLDLPAEMAAIVKEEAAGVDRLEVVRAIRTFGRVDVRDQPQSALPLELAVLDFIAEAPTPPQEPAPASVPPAAAIEPDPPQKPEPSFSIPVAEMDEIASTVTTASLGDPESQSSENTQPPASAPSMAPVGPGENLLDRVRQVSKETDKQLSALLNGSCEVKSVANDTIVLGFFHTFHLERVESGPYAQRLNELFSAQVGRSVKVVCEHAPRERSQAQTSSQGGHLVKAAQALGAKPVTGPDGEGGNDGE